MFSKLVVYLCQVSNDDGPYPIIGPANAETKGKVSQKQVTIVVIWIPLTGNTKCHDVSVKQFLKFYCLY